MLSSLGFTRLSHESHHISHDNSIDTEEGDANGIITVSFVDQSFDLENGKDNSSTFNERSPLYIEYTEKLSSHKRILHQLLNWEKLHPRVFSWLIVLLLVAIPIAVTMIYVTKPSTQSSDFNCNQSTGNEYEKFRVYSDLGVVATDDLTCSNIGLDVMQKGGNAMDAAIASIFCLGVISPASSGIGGGCFIVAYNESNEESIFIDSREVAPSQSHPNMFVTNPMQSQDGGLAIAVLGEVKGLYLAWTKFGSGNVPWSDLVMPAATLANRWVISNHVGLYLSKIQNYLLSGQFPALSALYTYMKHGRRHIKKVGDVVMQPALSNTLMNIAVQGSDYLYSDPMATTLALEIQNAGGIVTAEDIMNYQAVNHPTIQTEVFGHTYHGASGSSSGGAVVPGIIKFLEASNEPLISLGNVFYYRLVEAFNEAFALRSLLGDPSFVNDSIIIDHLLSDQFMSALYFNTSDDQLLPITEYGGIPHKLQSMKEDHGTSHISTLDSTGMAVSITTTINTYFGSKVISPSTGILFNNQMDDFSIPNASNYFQIAPSRYNFPVPYKRPLSSMSPSILVNKQSGKVRLVGGASAQVIINYFGKSMDLLSAVTSPRVHSQLTPSDVSVESFISNGMGGHYSDNHPLGRDIISYLRAKHFNVTESSDLGNTQFIAVHPDTGRLEAVSDPRKGGQPVGL